MYKVKPAEKIACFRCGKNGMEANLQFQEVIRHEKEIGRLYICKPCETKHKEYSDVLLLASGIDENK